MAYLSNLGASASVMDAWTHYPQIHGPMAQATEEILRNNAEIGEAWSEFVFAYCSAINDCSYCRGSHMEVARLMGVPDEVIDLSLEDPESEGIDPKLQALLVFARKLTLTPSAVGEADAQTVKDAGWSDDALHHLVCIASLAGFMNRFVIGCGMDSDAEKARSRGKLLKEHGYAGPFRQFAERAERQAG